MKNGIFAGVIFPCLGSLCCARHWALNMPLLTQESKEIILSRHYTDG